MARAGLEPDWECVLANDIDAMKCSTYTKNWGGSDLVCGDVKHLDPERLHQPIDLYWASSPCQDFSLAGKGSGLSGARSGVFNNWISIVESACAHGYGPQVIAFENVRGLLSSNSGQDFQFILSEFFRLGYKVGGFELNAVNFVPQSRPRLFLMAVRKDVALPGGIISHSPVPSIHSRKLTDHFERLTVSGKQNWIWWNPGVLPQRIIDLNAIIDINCRENNFAPVELEKLISIMSKASYEELTDRIRSDQISVGTLYKRGRPDASGKIRQRAEVRFDGIAGCLRTPAGGSSRQTVLIAGKGEFRARLLKIREGAKLMGLGEKYILPEKYNDAFRITGDGVAVPVVRFISERLLTPLMAFNRAKVAA